MYKKIIPLDHSIFYVVILLDCNLPCNLRIFFFRPLVLFILHSAILSPVATYRIHFFFLQNVLWLLFRNIQILFIYFFFFFLFFLFFSFLFYLIYKGIRFFYLYFLFSFWIFFIFYWILILILKCSCSSFQNIMKYL